MNHSEAGKLGAEKLARENKNWGTILHKSLLVSYSQNPKKCLYCSKILSYDKRRCKFCSHSCSAKYSNIKRTRIKKIEKISCVVCGKTTSYSDNVCKSCRTKDNYERFISGELNLQMCDETIKKYLISIFGYYCFSCGINDWQELYIPLELDHIDGNCKNNYINNLRLLCPNCHSQTDTYKGKNKSSGRFKRRQRYKEGKSY